MNILVTDDCPYQSARNLDDVNVLIQLVDNFIILSTICYYDHGRTFLKAGELDHPSVRWCRNDKNNTHWVMANTIGLIGQYSMRFKQQHANAKMVTAMIEVVGYKLPSIKLFQNRAPGFGGFTDTVMAYRYHMIEQWHNSERKPLWSQVGPPQWSRI